MASGTPTGRRCTWSGEVSDRAIEIRALAWVPRGGAQERSFWVLPEHEASLRSHLDVERRFRKVVPIGIAVGGVVAVGAAVTRHALVVLACVLILAITILVLPVPNPVTGSDLGIRGGRRLVRGLAAVMVAVAISVGVMVSIRGSGGDSRRGGAGGARP
jgi:hypothetical protein